MYVIDRASALEKKLRVEVFPVLVVFLLCGCEESLNFFDSLDVCELEKEYAGRLEFFVFACGNFPAENHKFCSDYGVINYPSLMLFFRGVPLVSIRGRKLDTASVVVSGNDAQKLVQLRDFIKSRLDILRSSTTA